MTPARPLMVQGTTSDAGKSTLVTGLCRWLHRRGVCVAPFKPQNMALNSAVTADGGEIGRAQAVQAQACGLAPHSDMNPVLLKPDSDTGAQVIVQGRVVGSFDALDYHRYKAVARHAVIDSWQRLCASHDAVIVEGAGSPAEINLRDNDIANMGFADLIESIDAAPRADRDGAIAQAADCPVVLIADIDRGGVFAHIVGTLALLSERERARVRGFVINRFRGDHALLQPGLDWLERETGKPVIGVLPYLHGLHLEAEDAVPRTTSPVACDALKMIVPALPHISNHTDVDPLRLHPRVALRFVGPGETIPPADVIILPGSKSVRHDLAWLRAQGWETAILRHLRYGGRVVGICGGFQMLGRAIHDPLGLEGDAGTTAGLGLLDMETTLEAQKQLRNVRGRLALHDALVSGYEIHHGISHGAALTRPLARLGNRTDGAISEDNRIIGTYLHGLFETTAACDALLDWAGLTAPQTPDYAALREAGIERLADAVETHLDLDRLAGLLRLPARRRAR